MTTYYLDLINGSDAASGLTSWANAKKSPDEFLGAVATDVVRVAKTATPVTVAGTWTVTPSAAGGSAFIQGSAALGVLEVFLGNPSVTYYNSASAQTPTNTLVTFRPPFNTARNGSAAGNGGAFSVASPAASTKYAVIDLGVSTDLSSYQEFFFWVGTNGNTTGMASTAPFLDNNVWRIKLCSDAAGDTVLEDWPLPVPFVTGGSWWQKFTPAGSLPSNVRSIAIYSGANTISNARIAFWGAYAVKSSATVRPGDLIRDTGTNFWTRVSLIEDGETTSPKLYALNLPGQEGYFPESRPSVSLEALSSPPVTTRSGIATSGLSRGDVYDGHNLASLANGVIWEGGYNTGSGLIDGYTVLDLGMDNGSYGSLFAVNSARTTEFRHFIQSGGYAYGSLPFHSATHVGLQNLTQVDCKHVPGALTANGTGGEITGSSFTDCFAYAGDEILTYATGTVTLASTQIQNPVNGVWSIRGTLVLNACTFIHYDGTIGYQNVAFGFTLQTVGTTRFIGGGTIAYQNSLPGLTSLQDHGPFDVVGHSLSPWRLAPSETISALTHVGQNYAASEIVFGQVSLPTSGANPAATLGATRLSGWSVTGVSLFELGGYTLEGSTVYVNNAGTLQDGAYGAIFEGCTLGRDADTGSFDLIANNNLRLYDTDLVRPVISKGDPRAYLEMVGGSVTGTSHDPIDASDADTSLWRMKFHNVAFDSDLAYLNSAGTSFYQRQGWIDNTDGMLSITSLNGSVGSNRIYSPNFRAETTSTEIRTAGGKSWKVTTNAILREGSTQWVIARVAVRGGLQLTAKVYVKVIEECYAYLKAWPGQVGANAAVRVPSTNQIGLWEELSVQLTPTVDGVMEFYLTFSTPVAGRVLYIDDISFEQV